MRSEYLILQITEWGTVKFINNDLKIKSMSIHEYIKYCCY